MAVVRDWLQRLKLRHLVAAFAVGVALSICGFVMAVLAAFWGAFSAWGACGDGASEMCLRQHPSIAAAIGQGLGSAALTVGNWLISLSLLGLLLLLAARFLPLLRGR
jgi:hypothetical protein